MEYLKSPLTKQDIKDRSGKIVEVISVELWDLMALGEAVEAKISKQLFGHSYMLRCDNCYDYSFKPVGVDENTNSVLIQVSVDFGAGWEESWDKVFEEYEDEYEGE